MDSDCSHEIKRFLLLGRKVMKPRQYIKNREIILPTMVYMVKVKGFFPPESCTDVRLGQ